MPGRAAKHRSGPRSEQRPELSVRQAALNLLGAREYSRYSLARKLREKQYPATDIDALLDDFESAGWLDDARYARLYIRSRLSRGHGPIRIAMDISQKGVDRHIFNAALRQLEDEEAIDWCALCQQTYNRRFAGKSLPKNRQAAFKERARRYRYLASRGFSAEQIQYVLNE